MRRALDLDVHACPRRGGRLRDRSKNNHAFNKSIKRARSAGSLHGSSLSIPFRPTLLREAWGRTSSAGL